MTSEWIAESSYRDEEKICKAVWKKKKNEGKNWKENGEMRLRNIDGEQQCHTCDCQGFRESCIYSGPYLFNVFLKGLNIFHNDVPVLFKYADDSTIIAPQ